MNTFNKATAASRTKWGGRFVAALAISSALASCGLVDSQPGEQTAVHDVMPYYAKLQTPGMEYHYTTSYARSGMAASRDTLQMEMYGAAPSYNGMPTYGCDWTFIASGYAPKWYYALSADSAVDLGDYTFSEHWTDLKAPLAKGNTWTFVRKSGEIVTAKITEFGATVKINGQQFSNVIAVEYTGNLGTTSVRWFAKDTGMIFGHTQFSDGSVSEEKFVDMGMEN